MSAEKHKIAFVMTAGMFLDIFYPDFYPLAESKGYEIVGICAADRFVANVTAQGVRVIEVPMTRTFTPFRDLVCLLKLYRIFRAEKFDLINYSTPKAALLSAIAAKTAGSTRLLYTVRGLAYTGFSGLKRMIAKGCETIACRNADTIIAISPTLKAQIVEEGLTNAEKIVVYGLGSSKGVNLKTFQCNDQTLQRARQIRKALNLSADDVVFGYAGRFTVEKGIIELLDAFEAVSKQSRQAHLLLVGQQDQRMPLPQSVLDRIDQHRRIHVLPFTADMPAHLAAMDVFVLASYREGFGNVLIEASALQRPVIASDIPGCRDAVKPGLTGLLVSPRNSASLQSAMQTLMADPNQRQTMGQNGRKWVESAFNRDKIWAWLFEVFASMLQNPKRT